MMTDERHFCFVTYGSWRGNAGLIRPRHLGAELIELGQRVSYIVDDVPYNRTSLELHPKANMAYVSPSRGLGQIGARRKKLTELHPTFVHVLNPHAKSLAALAGTESRVIADWDEPNILKNSGFMRNRMESAPGAMAALAGCAEHLLHNLAARVSAKPVWLAFDLYPACSLLAAVS